MQMVTADIPSFQRRAASVNLGSPNMNIEVVHSVAHSLYEIWEKILVNQRSGEWWKGIPSTPPDFKAINRKIDGFFVFYAACQTSWRFSGSL